MPATRAALSPKLDSLGIPPEPQDPPPVFTVAESTELHDRMPGGHTKNLFLKDAKGALFLLIAESHAEIELKTLHKRLGCKRLSFGKPDLLMEKLGVSPGSVTALSVINDTAGDVTVFIDQTLLGFETINCHPLENTATTAIGREDLLRFLEACGHPATPIDLAAPPPAD